MTIFQNIASWPDMHLGWITLIGALIILVIYVLQERSKRKEAAIIIYNEIENAENIITEILDTDLGFLKDLAFIRSKQVINQGHNNWDTFKHLLITRRWMTFSWRKLSFQEMKRVDDFYRYCNLFQNEILRLKNAFYDQTSAKGKEVQFEILKLGLSTVKEDIAILDAQQLEERRKNYKIKRDNFLDIVHAENYWFRPNDAVNAIAKYITLIKTVEVVNTPISEKLRKIAGL